MKDLAAYVGSKPGTADGWALGPDRFAKMLLANEGVDTPLDAVAYEQDPPPPGVDYRDVAGPPDQPSMPDAATAKDVTGYERGTITPFGATTAWPVIADEAIVGRTISMGGGAHGVGVTVAADDVIGALGAAVADVSGG